MKCLFALLAGFAAVTAAWATWAFLTPGDYFANGSLLVVPSLIVAAMIGMCLPIRYTSLAFRACIVIAAVLALCYWVFVPDGWWATPPGG